MFDLKRKIVICKHDQTPATSIDTGKGETVCGLAVIEYVKIIKNRKYKIKNTLINRYCKR